MAPNVATPGSHNDPRALLEPILAAIEGDENLRNVRDAALCSLKGLPSVGPKRESPLATSYA